MPSSPTLTVDRTDDASPEHTGPKWAAVWALSLGVASLSTAEMLPMSLLTPMAENLVSAVWGFAAGMVPVGWSTWLTRAIPHNAESGGGSWWPRSRSR